jgi:hypothetical protein
MSNDTKQPQPPKQPRPEAIPIKLIRFDGTTDVPGLQISGMSANGRNPAEKRPGGHHHDIEFQPWLRRFRFAYVEGGKSEPKTVAFVHERFVRSYEEW